MPAKETRKEQSEVGGNPGGTGLLGGKGGAGSWGRWKWGSVVAATKGFRCLQRSGCGKDTKQAFGFVIRRSSEL